ncbi:MAG: DUF4175 domain-containing protein, partial [Pseudorhodoplanes sp.]
MQDSVEQKRSGAAEAERATERLEKAVRKVRWGLLWEQVWPPVAALLTLGGFFLSVSWLGLWLWLPAIGRAAGVALFGLAAAGKADAHEPPQ